MMHIDSKILSFEFCSTSEQYSLKIKRVQKLFFNPIARFSAKTSSLSFGFLISPNFTKIFLFFKMFSMLFLECSNTLSTSINLNPKYSGHTHSRFSRGSAAPNFRSLSKTTFEKSLVSSTFVFLLVKIEYHLEIRRVELARGDHRSDHRLETVRADHVLLGE